MLEVYQECAKICKYICTITRNPTRKKQIKRLDLITENLLEKAGFEIRYHFHSQLFTVTKTKNNDIQINGKISHWRKYFLMKGHPIADHEDIIIAKNEQ